MSGIIRCSRCHRRRRDQSEWFMLTNELEGVTAWICPKCMTPEESAEAMLTDAAVNVVATEYMQAYLNSLPPKNDA